MGDVKPDTSEAAVETAAEMLDAYDFDVTAALLRALLAERDAALTARDDAIRRMADAARDAGRWRGISEGNDVVIKHLRAERDALRAQLTEVLAENDAVRFQLNNANATLREAGHETRALTPDEQKIMRRALRRSVKVIGEDGHE